MLSPAATARDVLPPDHPCCGCDVRHEAVCRVLDCDDLATFRRMGWSLRLRSGQTLFHEGDPANRVFTLTSGTLKLYKLLPDGRRQVTGFLFPGDFLGLALDQDHAFTVEAVEDAQLCWFPRNRFGGFVESHPEMERTLYLLAAHELTAARLQMVLLGRKTAEERLASFFVGLVERAGRDEGGSATEFDLPMSRSDIADYLGLTKETVSRVLARLKARRLIRLVALDRIELLDRSGLVAVAEGLGRID